MAQAALYVELVPTTSGIKRNIEKDLDGSFNTAESKGKSVFGKIAGFAGKAAAVVGIAAGALAGLAIKGGFERLLRIEDAEAKLVGLGNSTETVTTIMNNALASVKGTAFGLDDAATVAATAVAAGIKPGAELERVLRLTADAATIAGSSLGEMGSIFGKVAATGKLTGEVVAQLQDRGVPILQFVAEEMGITAEAAREMVSRGEVDFATFAAAMETNLGGAALKSGATTRGAFANMQSALSRVGIAMIGGIFPYVQPALSAVTTLLDGITEKIGPFGENFAEIISSAMSGDGLADMNLGQVIIDQFLNLSAWLSGGGLQSIFDTLTASREGFLGAMLQALPGIIDAIVQILPIAITALLGFVTGGIALLIGAAPQLLQAGIQLFSGLIDGVVASLPGIIQAIVALIPVLLTTMVSLIPVLLEGAVMLFTSLIEAIAVIVPLLITAILDLLPILLTTIIGLIPVILDAAISLFMALVEALPVVLPMLIQAVVDLIPVVITAILDLIPKILDAAIALFMALVDSLPIILPLLITSIIGLIPTLITTIIGLIPKILDAAIKLFTALVTAIPEILPKLISAVIGLIPVIISALIGAVPQLIKAGVDLIGGLIQGLWDAAGTLGTALIDIAKNAIGGFLSFLGIASPSKLFAGFGANMGEGLALGIHGSGKAVSKALDDLNSLVDIPAMTARIDTSVADRSDASPLNRNANGSGDDVRPTDLSDSTIEKLGRAVLRIDRTRNRMGDA